MPYMIEAWDAPDQAAQRQAIRPVHLEYLARHAPFLLACGAKLTEDGSTATGSFYIVDTDVREEAQRFIEGDPFHGAGVFGRVVLTRWRKSYLDGRSYL